MRARGRLWVAVLGLALVPAAIGVLLTTSLLEEPDAAIAADRGRATSAAAADLLVHEQRIEARLTAVAAKSGLSRLSERILRQSERQLSRSALIALRGPDGPVVAGACITRTADKRTTVLLDAETASGPESACATGALLVRAAGAAVGEVEREHIRRADGSYRLLLATPLGDGSGRGNAVLAAEVDVDSLFATARPASAVAPAAMLVDLQTSRVVAGSSRPSGAEAAMATAPSTGELSVYVNGILSNHRATTDSLARAGWVTTVASLWPTITGSRLGLIHVWPTPAAPTSTLLVMALVALAVASIFGALAFMRHLIGPFHELEESQEQLAHMYREARQDALHDGLTGMGNHRSFQEELARQVEVFERDGVPFTLLLLDLDNLKVVNDREGHAEGDRLITGMADSIREAFRATDRQFRIGGDEFAVLMPDTESEVAVEAAGRLRHFGLRPLAGKPATPFSGGISAVPRFAQDPIQLYRQADVALYWAKRHGRGFVEVFDIDRDQLPGESGPVGASNAVYEVARGRRFSPVFQPIVDLRTGVVLGFEGLVRPDPQGPFPNAEALFTAAAATDRTVELDLACLEVVAAGASGISGDHIVSINLSAKTLEVKEFDSGWLINTLVRHGISPSRVIVELTERDPISDVRRLKENVRHLGQYGLRLAADDVGAGNAGLRLLSQVQFDIVKIDLSLVHDSAQSTASWALLRSLRDLAWRQDALVIGEGVEHPEQLRALRQLDIPIGQGYLLGRPNPRLQAAPVDLADLSAHGEVAVPVPSASGDQRRNLHLPGPPARPLLRPPDVRQLQPSPVPIARP